ncbi:MAG: poly-beta-1,6 N-acetyl-D-glucosamine export porin PgaA [bacterium]|nr:poly-beta-1,6 N-acetyl-D-glucosamine export porin PgaA [bacterium]
MFWTVQAATFAGPRGATRLMTWISVPGGRVEKIGRWYTVRYGFFTRSEEARTLRARLLDQGVEAPLLRTCYNIPERIVVRGDSGSEPAGDRLFDGDEAVILDAVLQARQGEVEEALATLGPIRAKRPEDRQLQIDHMVLLGWAGRDEEALQQAEGFDIDEAPAYLIESLAKSARNTGRFDQAVELYTRAITKSPQSVAGYVGLAMAQADGGRPEEALQSLAPMLTANPGNADILFARAYAHGRAGKRLEALWDYEEILRLDPRHREASRRRLLVLSALGAPGPALREGGEHPDTGLLSADEMDHVQADWAAAKVRWGEIPSPGYETRFAETDEAIAILDNRIRRLTAEEGLSETATPVLRARFDRMVALRNRYRMADVAAEYERLKAQDVAVPVYGQQAAGDAYLYLERPREAEMTYREALSRDPRNFNIETALFWALIDQGEFESATEIIDRLEAEQSAWRINRSDPARPVYGKNENRLLAAATAAQARAFSDDLQGAEERMESLTGRAPFSHDLRQRLGYVYLWRGWPRRALAEYEQVLASDPQLLDARVGRGEALLDLGEYRAAQANIDRLGAEYPEMKQVANLQRRWDIHNKGIFTTSVGLGSDSQGDQDTDSFRIDSYLYSRPMAYHWRLFGRGYYETGDLDIEDDDVSVQRESIGLRYGGRDLVTFVALDRTRETDKDIGVSGELGWNLNDHWTVGVALDSSSLEVPLRARYRDIEAWSAAAEVVYRAHESAQVRASLQRLDFDDKNIRVSGLLAYEQRVINGPYFKLPVTLELYGSRNSKEDRPYFNPETDLSGTVTADLRWLLWRWYRRSFAHHLAFSGGFYRQREFDTEGIGAVRYEHDWQISDTLSLLYGVTWRRRVYDGESEKGTWSYFTVDWRF